MRKCSVSSRSTTQALCRLTICSLPGEKLRKGILFKIQNSEVRIMKTLCTVVILSYLLLAPALGDTIRVPQDQSTIQAGIDAAANGDTVLVADNTYFENINFLGKAITVASHYILNGDTNHIANTVIDGSQPSHPDSGSVVTFESGEDTTSVLTGFTITGGIGTLSEVTYAGTVYLDRLGGGILVYLA